LTGLQLFEWRLTVTQGHRLKYYSTVQIPVVHCDYIAISYHFGDISTCIAHMAIAIYVVW